MYEAAEIDGTGEFRRFFTIALPLSKPIIAVMALYYGVWRWNDYYNAMIYTTSKELEPLQSVFHDEPDIGFDTFDLDVSFIGGQFIGGIVIKGIHEGADEYSGCFGIVVDHGV